MFLKRHLCPTLGRCKDEKKEYLDIIIEESNRLSNLSTNVLKLSKIENKDFKLNLEQFLLDEQIRKSILILEARWSKKNLEFELELERTNLIADKESVTTERPAIPHAQVRKTLSSCNAICKLS